MAAGAGGAALVWASPTLTRSALAQSGPSDDSGDPGDPDACSYAGFFEDFSGVDVPGGAGFTSYGTGWYATGTSSDLAAAAQGFQVATPGNPGNIDIIVAQDWGISGFASGTQLIGLGGSYYVNDGAGNQATATETRQIGAASITLTLPAGDYLLEFDWESPSGSGYNPRAATVSLSGATFAGPSSSTSIGPGGAGVVNHFSEVITSAGGSVTITLSDTALLPDGTAFTNFEVTCAVP